jgi:hypothetical protein
MFNTQKVKTIHTRIQNFIPRYKKIPQLLDMGIVHIEPTVNVINVIRDFSKILNLESLNLESLNLESQSYSSYFVHEWMLCE